MPRPCYTDNAPESTTPTNDRDAGGRFAPGNPGGPGNPYARQVARLRSALLAAVTEEDIQAIIRMQVTKARMGDKEATRLVLQYTIGKPAAAVNPDRVDLDEWRQRQECPTPNEMKDLLNRAPPTVLVGLHRGDTVMHVQQFHDQLDAMDAADRAQAPPSPNGDAEPPAPPPAKDCPRRAKADGAPKMTADPAPVPPLSPVADRQAAAAAPVRQRPANGAAPTPNGKIDRGDGRKTPPRRPASGPKTNRRNKPAT